MMPVLYEAPVPLTPEAHGTKSLGTQADYFFAAQTNSVPLNGPEFPAAAQHYPIVFTAGAPLAAVAVVGLRPSENLFVDERGAWRADTYIPAYLRRYPFIFIQGASPTQFVLGVEEKSPLVVEGQQRPFFVDGKPTPLVDQALRFCSEFQSHYDATSEMCAELERLDLLVNNRADAVLAGGQRTVLSGFRIIDENRLNSLRDEDFLTLRHRKWLGWIYCHLVSLGKWSVLGTLAAQSAGAKRVN
ncbi:MAG TPA: SapC family protein [Alphaproteobacteria bacterium]|nr:SapC family protein [Alphaproteobacteria bacterium]